MTEKALWPTVPLAEVLEFREGPGIMAYDFRPQGVPLIRLAGLKPGSRLLDGCNYLDPDTVGRRWEQFRVRRGDTLLSTSASLGEVAVVPKSAEGAIPYTGIIRFRPRDSRLLAQFIPYALRAPRFRRQIEEMGVGSVMRHFGPMHLRQMTLEVPPLDSQRAMAEVLSALDDKIDSNRRIELVCTQLAAGLFQNAADGRAPLGEIANITMGQSPPGDTYNTSGEGLPFYQGTRDFGLRHPSRRVWCTSGTRCATSKDVMVSVRAPVGRLNVAVEDCVIGRGVAGLGSAHPSTLYQALAADPSVWAPYEAQGTVFGAIGKHEMAEIVVPWPSSQELLPSLEQELAILDARLLAAVRETAVLSAVRECLLPALLSGQLRVRDAEKAVEQAV